MSTDVQITPGALSEPDPAELGQLSSTIEQLLPAMEEFWRYRDRDDAARAPARLAGSSR